MVRSRKKVFFLKKNGEVLVGEMARNNSQSAMLRMPSLLESGNSLMHLWTSLEKKINPADIFTDGNWILSQSRTMSSRRGELMAIVMVKLKHRRSI